MKGAVLVSLAVGYVQCYVQNYVHTAQCSSEHVHSALAVISQCKPREVVIQLPWPNNTDIQQVKVVITLLWYNHRLGLIQGEGGGLIEEEGWQGARKEV